MATREVEDEKRATSPADTLAFFASANKTVLTFLGFSGAGYEKPDVMLKAAADILYRFDPKSTVVNIGATPGGIGKVYEIAKDCSFETIGIVSTEALKHNSALSPFVDQVFFIQDETWGGFLDDKTELSPTSKAMVLASDVLVAIGGGKVVRDELIVAKIRGKKIIFISADMNHALARVNAQKKGLAEPTNFQGEAAALFDRK